MGILSAKEIRALRKWNKARKEELKTNPLPEPEPKTPEPYMKQEEGAI